MSLPFRPFSFLYRAAIGSVSVFALTNVLCGCSKSFATEDAPLVVLTTQTASTAGSAQTADSTQSGLPAGGVRLVAPDVTRWSLTGADKAGASVETVSVSGQSFSQAQRITTTKASPNPWDTQVYTRSDSGTHQGDVLLARVWVRAIKGQPETGEARISLCVERNHDPYTKSLEFEIACPRDWTRMDIPFTAAEDLSADQVGINFRLGLGAQIVEIGGVEIWNFGKSVPLERLPKTKASYHGMEANAPWRKAAEERIEKIRKGPLAVQVVDAQGHPVKNAQVEVRMTRHAFPFGSAVAGDGLFGTSPDDEKYRDFILKHFNRVVIENDLKWPNWESRPQFGKDTVAWLRKHNVEVRGHNLVWPSWRNSPQRLRALASDKAALAKAVNEHIRDEAGALSGQLVCWDVINEPFDNHDIMDILGRDSMVHWFKLTRSLDPKATLVLNDYPPLDGAAKDNAHLNSFYNNITYLKQNGAPIGGIGFQCHFGSTVIPPERILSGLDRFQKLGLPISITEFDINTTDMELQTTYMRDLMTAAFSHPAVDSIIMWGFWEGRHWLPRAALLNRDWTVKPNGQMWLDLVEKKWWTNADGTTDGGGRYTTRGFFGDYAITVKAGGKTVRKALTLRKGGQPLRVVVP